MRTCQRWYWVGHKSFVCGHPAVGEYALSIHRTALCPRHRLEDVGTCAPFMGWRLFPLETWRAPKGMAWWDAAMSQMWWWVGQLAARQLLVPCQREMEGFPFEARCNEPSVGVRQGMPVCQEHMDEEW